MAAGGLGLGSREGEAGGGGAERGLTTALRGLYQFRQAKYLKRGVGRWGSQRYVVTQGINVPDCCSKVPGSNSVSLPSLWLKAISKWVFPFASIRPLSEEKNAERA